MGSRPLRQRYQADLVFDVDIDIAALLTTWVRHRERLVAALQQLTDEQWSGPTRCDDWSVQEVIHHLITADGFWVATLTNSRGGNATEFLRDFNPSESPQALVDALADWSPSQSLDGFTHGTNSFLDTVASFDDDEWHNLAESPLGHVPAYLALAHAGWDSWLHERDILEPLGRAPAVQPDDAWSPTWYSLFAAGMQGGLIDDPQPVGPGATEPIDVSLTFADLDERVLHLRVSDRLTLCFDDQADPHPLVVPSAIDLVEGFTGRKPIDPNLGLPPDLLAHFARAAGVL